MSTNLVNPYDQWIFKTNLAYIKCGANANGIIHGLETQGYKKVAKALAEAVKAGA